MCVIVCNCVYLCTDTRPNFTYTRPRYASQIDTHIRVPTSRPKLTSRYASRMSYLLRYSPRSMCVYASRIGVCIRVPNWRVYTRPELRGIYASQIVYIYASQLLCIYVYIVFFCVFCVYFVISMYIVISIYFCFRGYFVISIWIFYFFPLIVCVFLLRDVLNVWRFSVISSNFLYIFDFLW